MRDGLIGLKILYMSFRIYIVYDNVNKYNWII